MKITNWELVEDTINKKDNGRIVYRQKSGIAIKYIQIARSGTSFGVGAYYTRPELKGEMPNIFLQTGFKNIESAQSVAINWMRRNVN
jgi:hypothetical protein